MLLFQEPLILSVFILLGGLLFSLIISGKRENVIRSFSLYISLAALAVGLVSCLTFNKAVSFQYLFSLDFLPIHHTGMTFGADGISITFLLLTLFVFPVCFIAAWPVAGRMKVFFSFLLAMELLLLLTFTTLDIFYFYIFFESLLIPMFIMIGVWGARERKIKAAYYFFLYTLFGSLFMLFALLYLYFLTGSTNFNAALFKNLNPEHQKLIWFCFFLAFAVKMPLFPLHIWLPEAHVEAPTTGSMLLASLLLKLGGYGFLRFSVAFLSEGAAYFAPVLSTLALLGVIYGSLSTIRQIDLKRIIAYSSVAHMNLVMLGVFSYSQQGIDGSTYLMVGHGVVSTALFFCVGVLYDRHHSRLLRYYGGVVTVMPLFATAFFLFSLANMGFPGTSNFLGELLLLLGVFAKNSTILLLSTAGIVLSAVYSVWLFNRTTFGTLKTTYIKHFSDLNRREFFTLLFLVIPMFILGVTSTAVLEFIYFPVKQLLVTATVNTQYWVGCDPSDPSGYYARAKGHLEMPTREEYKIIFAEERRVREAERVAKAAAQAAAEAEELRAAQEAANRPVKKRLLHEHEYKIGGMLLDKRVVAVTAATGGVIIVYTYGPLYTIGVLPLVLWQVACCVYWWF